VEVLTKCDPDVTQAVSNVWKDRANWPEHVKEQAQPFQITPQVWQFIHSAMECAK
jgi:hypothetical protein